ncbi:MAG TPA: 30S ribosomal protein S5 [Sphingomicrobium sp.]|nr:30S ribosomal protein S5 [Sphingomicrobium sp.]
MADEKETPQAETAAEAIAEPQAPAEAVTEAAPAEATAEPQAPAEAATEAAPAAPEAAPAEATAETQAPAEAAPAAPEAREARGPRGGRGRGGGGRDNRGGGRGRRDDRRGGRGGDDDGGEELIEKLVHINRVSKTVKGGKRFGFAALVVVGDGKGRAGFGHGKAREVPEAISKATAAAKKSMVRVPLRDGRTLHHDGKGHFGAGKVAVRAAPAGTGIIAGGPMRAVFESLGVADVVTKSVGTSNPYNMIRATFEALKDQTSPRSVAQRRGKKISDLLGRGGMDKGEAEATAEAVTE